MRHVCGAPGQGLGCAASARGPMLAALPCGVSRPPPRARLLLARVGEEQQGAARVRAAPCMCTSCAHLAPGGRRLRRPVLCLQT